ncbi:MAG: DNA cytosine methyltransferase [Luteolibacter sp.]
MKKVADLFSGVGGLSLGFQRAGFDIVGSFDSWGKAIDVYRDNFSHPSFVADLSNMEAVLPEIERLKPDLIIGGPPCQDFSQAGKRNEGGRANLTHIFSKIVTTLSPEMFVMENVARAESSAAYKLAREEFRSAGYGLTEIVLDASLCGVPQKRKRFFCIGRKNEYEQFLLGKINASLSQKPMTPKRFFGREMDFDHYYRHPRNYNRRGIFSMDEPAPTIRGVNRPVPPNYPGHAGDTTTKENVRSLSTYERARMQTFPKSFKWKGTKTDMEQMIGNAVPVDLAAFVAGIVMNYLESNEKGVLQLAEVK